MIRQRDSWVYRRRDKGRKKVNEEEVEKKKDKICDGCLRNNEESSVIGKE